MAWEAQLGYIYSAGLDAWIQFKKKIEIQSFA